MNVALANAFLDTAIVYGSEHVELEFRRGAPVHPSSVDRIRRALAASPLFQEIGTVETREEYSDGDARRVTWLETGGVDHVYKKRIARVDLSSPGESATVSLETWGPPPDPPATFQVYRKKRRTKWRYRCWEVHITAIQTNDPRFKDGDSEVYDIELELQTGGKELYQYTVDALIEWGHAIFDHLIRDSQTRHNTTA